MNLIFTDSETRRAARSSRAIVPTVVLIVLSIGFLAGSSKHGQIAGATQVDVSPEATAEVELDSMTAGAVAMILTADAMEAGADVLDEEAQRRGDPVLTDLASHWRTDADDLRDRGVWMLLTNTAGAMIHDPDKAHQLDLRSLRANGESMIIEGDSMIEHGREMSTQISELRSSGVLPPELADRLTATADGMVSAGERIVEDGEDMRDYAERMLQSLGE